MRAAIVIAGLVWATAQAQQPPEPAPSAESPEGGSSDRLLSKEDAELIKDLAVLERMDLLRNLDLFEEPKQPENGEQRQQ